MPIAAPHPAIAMMAAETLTRRGSAPRRIGRTAVREGCWATTRDSFLLRAEGGIALYYERGGGVIVDAPDDVDPRDLSLWLNGTIYAAIAAINGLTPIHASAVAHHGRVYAFTGPAGAGKSTLVAALGRLGFAQVCDDTMLLDMSGSGAPLVLPGHKRLKLWAEGAALAQVVTGEEVAGDYPKRFVEPATGSVEEALPLAELLILAPGSFPSFTSLAAGERVAALDGDEHYTTQLRRLASPADRAGRFAGLAALAARVPMTRFIRPFEGSAFGQGVAAAAAHIRRHG